MNFHIPMNAIMRITLIEAKQEIFQHFDQQIKFVTSHTFHLIDSTSLALISTALAFNAFTVRREGQVAMERNILLEKKRMKVIPFSSLRFRFSLMLSLYSRSTVYRMSLVLVALPTIAFNQLACSDQPYARKSDPDLPQF